MELVLRDRRVGKLGWDFRLRQTALTGLLPELFISPSLALRECYEASFATIVPPVQNLGAPTVWKGFH